MLGQTLTFRREEWRVRAWNLVGIDSHIDEDGQDWKTRRISEVAGGDGARETQHGCARVCRGGMYVGKGLWMLSEVSTGDGNSIEITGISGCGKKKNKWKVLEASEREKLEPWVKREMGKEMCSSQVSSLKAELVQVNGKSWEGGRGTGFEIRVEGWWRGGW